MDEDLERFLAVRRKLVASAAPQVPAARKRAVKWWLGGGLLAAVVLLLVAAWLMQAPPSPTPQAGVALSLPPAPPPAANLEPAAPPRVELPVPAVPAPAPTPQVQPQPQPPETTGWAALPPAEPPSASAPAWLRFAVPAPASQGRPRIALVIDDMGLDRARSDRAVALNGPVTLSYLAYAEDLKHQTEVAHRDGHELLVHVPMEPLARGLDMGPNGISTHMSQDEVLRALRWDLDRFEGYVGINNHMGSKFTGDEQGMSWVLAELKARGLFFLDSRTIANSTGKKVAIAAGVPYAARDVFLDDDQSAPAVAARLREVEDIARRDGTAIAIGHPHDATLNALGPWLASLPQKGLVLVPLSDIVKARMAGG